MSLRHSVRERDVRLHDPHAPPPPPGPPVAVPPGAAGPPPPPPHSVHMNGNVAAPPPPPISNGHGHAHGPAIGHGAPLGLSPVAAPAGPPVPHANGGGPPPPPAAPSSAAAAHPTLQKLAKANEETWLLIGSVAEQMGDLDRALSAYERALLHNPNSLPGLTQIAGIARIRENYTKAIEYFQRVLQFQQDNGEVWSALGHCYLMQDDLQKAYSAYQQALYLLPNPKEDPKLWYGIGILYDRYGSLDHAEEAFASVLHMDKDFDKANEILFRLGIIYKQQGKYTDSLDCFDRILRNPPNPLAHADIWFQIGHVYEQQKDYIRAKDAYERVVQENPAHAKVLQQLGWLYHQEGSTFQSQDLAITYLTKSLEADPSDAQSWYLLGRAYMAGQKYNKAYEAYQQAVYRDGRNPTFWCSIGVLYFQINQYRDALDAYSRAIRINPYISEVWFDLGSLYESCNNQISDAIDAYARAAELDPSNTVITQRLALLRQAQQSGQTVSTAAPLPQDVHPTAYASAVGPPVTMTGGPPMLLSSGPTPRPIFSRSEAREHPGENTLPSPHTSHAPPPFRGGPPPPVVLDDSRRGPPSHTPLAPMEVDRATPRDGFPPRESSRSRGPGGTPQNSLLLHHPSSQQIVPEHQRDPAYYGRQPQRRPVSPSVSPPPRQARGPPEPRDVGYHGYPPAPPPTNGSVTGRPPAPVVQRSPRPYSGHYEAASPPPPPPDAWERERRLERERSRPRRDSDRGVPPNVQGFSQSRGPSSPLSAHPYDPHGHPPSRRTTMESPMMGRPPSPGHPMSRQVSMSERSPVAGPGAQGPGFSRWQSRYQEEPGRSPHAHGTSPTMVHSHSQAPPPSGTPSRRYDPRFDETSSQGSRMERVERIERMDRERFEREQYERRMLDEARERERMEARSHGGSPEMHRSASAMSGGPSRSVLPPPPTSTVSTSEYQAPYPPPSAAESTGRRGRKAGKESDTMSMHGPPTPAPASAGSSSGSQSSDKRKRRSGGRRAKEGSEGGSRAPSVQPSSFRVAPIPPQSGSIKSPPSPEPKSSASASGSSGRSSRPSPIGNIHASGLPRREVDEDYDEGVAESLMSLATSGGTAPPPVSPTVSVGGRIRHVSPRSRNRGDTTGLASGQLPGPGPLSVMTSQNGNGKRPLSPISTPDSGESKRSRVEILNRPTMNRITTPPPQPSSRPSPIPFRTQPTRSPEDRVQPSDRDVRMHERSPSSATNTTGIPSTMPLPPPPSAVVSNQGPILPPIATLPVSPTSSGEPSPLPESDRMHVDVGRSSRRSHSRSGSDSTTPPVTQSVSRTKISDVMNPTGSESSHARRNSSTHSSPTNAHSQGNAMAARTSPKAKSTSPRS